MQTLSTYSEIENAVIEIRGQRVILDADVARLYQVETKRVNEAVRNNPEKFPSGYILYLEKEEVADLRSKFSTANLSAKSRVMPKAFTEKGLYMLATILKSPKATATTIGIVETFAKLRELTRNVRAMAGADELEQKSLMAQSGEILADLLDDSLATTDSETTIELNLAVLKVKHTVKRKKAAEKK